MHSGIFLDKYICTLGQEPLEKRGVMEYIGMQKDPFYHCPSLI